MPPPFQPFVHVACWVGAVISLAASGYYAGRLPVLETRPAGRRGRFRLQGRVPRGWFEDVRTGPGRRARRRMVALGALAIALFVAGWALLFAGW